MKYDIVPFYRNLHRVGVSNVTQCDHQAISLIAGKFIKPSNTVE
jgi:hypothetical protein